MRKIRAVIVPPTVCRSRGSRETEKIKSGRLNIEHSLATTGSSVVMSRHVILLTDAHEAPAYELIEALRLAGVKTLIEGLREVEAEAALIRRRETESMSDQLQKAPVAILYEVFAGADMVELHSAIDHAKTFWPGTQVIACRRH